MPNSASPDISIHILHTKDDDEYYQLDKQLDISIHILHTKDDLYATTTAVFTVYFNPHPSYEGWRKMLKAAMQ